MVLFRTRVAVRVQRDLVTFSHKAKSCSLVPCLYLDAATPQGVVLGVGEPPPATPPAVRIDLFHEPVFPLDYGGVLGTFLRHGLFCLLGRGRRWKPHFHFAVTPEVSVYLRQYDEAIFYRAALDAGAPRDSIVIDRHPAA